MNIMVLLGFAHVIILNVANFKTKANNIKVLINQNLQKMRNNIKYCSSKVYKDNPKKKNLIS